MDECFCDASYVFLKYMYDCCTVQGYAFILASASISLLTAKIKWQGTLVTRGRFQSKIQEIKNGKSEKSCDVVFGLQVGFPTGPLSRGGTPYDGLNGQAPPEMGIFLRLQVYGRVGKCVI